MIFLDSWVGGLFDNFLPLNTSMESYISIFSSFSYYIYISDTDTELLCVASPPTNSAALLTLALAVGIFS